MSASQPYILIAVLVLVAGAIYFINTKSVRKTGPREVVPVVQQNEMKKEEKSKQYELAKEISTPDGFINTGGKPLTVSELVGKNIVLVDFWTYSCINCQRTTPYLNAWYEEYTDSGLVIIGVHTPEFEFEEDYNNVKAAVEKFGIKFPVVLDNDYSTWTAYKNRYWPHKYLIDIDGYVVYDHIGEGAYEETEMKIRELLAERAHVLGASVPNVEETLVVSSVPEGKSAARSPETYFGSLRNEYLANGTPSRAGIETYLLPNTFIRNSLYLGGTWRITPEYAESVSGASIVYKYNAKEVYVVADADIAVALEVLQDGKPVGTFGGADVNDDGDVVVQESRLYKLILNPKPGEHILELKVKGGGLRVYAFTFG